MTHDELIAARAGAAADGDLTLVRVCDEAIAARKSADDLGDALRRLGAGGAPSWMWWLLERSIAPASGTTTTTTTMRARSYGWPRPTC